MTIDSKESLRRLRLLRQTIMDNQDKFDYMYWFYQPSRPNNAGCDIVAKMVRQELDPMVALETECGTTACIAGWTVAIFRDEVIEGNGRHVTLRLVPDEAQELLGLTWLEAERLFYPDEFEDDEACEYAHSYEAAMEKLDTLISKKEMLS